MPNQRDEDKRKVGVWLSPEEAEKLKRVAAELGVSQSDVLRMAIEQKFQTAEKDGKNGQKAE